MRKLVIAIVLSLSAAACQSVSQPPAPRTAVHAETRFEIARAMSASGEQRAIVDMRDVTADSAVVLTAPKGDSGAAQREERWVRDGGGWKLASTSDLAAR
jgi:hypothetical protein